MHHPMLVLDAHVQAVTTNRMQQALLARQIRQATAGQAGPLSVAITNIRRAAGRSLIALGTRLHQESPRRAAAGMERLAVTPSRGISS